MGAALGGLSDADQAQIQKQLNDLLLCFSGQFTVAYKNALLDKIKADREESPSPYQLEAPPERPNVELHSGWLWKQGELNKAWKRRFGVANGPSKKYTVEYFVDEERKTKKGEITLRGYRVHDMSEEEIHAAGEHASFGLKLVPWNSSRRTWYLGFEKEEDSKAWRGALEDGCWYAPEPRCEDELIAEAFSTALTATRYEYNYWGWWAWEMPEAEQLGDFVNQVINSTILDGILANVPDNAAKPAAVAAIKKVVGTTVSAGVKASWSGAYSAMTAARATMEEAMKALISPILDQQDVLKGRVVETVGGIVRPLFSVVGEKCIKPFLRFALKHISESHVAFLRACTVYMAENVEAIGTDPSKHQEATLRMMRHTDYYYWPPISNGTRDVVQALNKSDALDKLTEISESRVSNDTIISQLFKRFRELGLNAAWTFKKETSLPMFDLARRKEVLRDVIGKLTNDLKENLNETITSVIADTMQSMVDQSIMKPALSAVEPLASAVPEALSQFIDISELTRATVQEIVDNDLIGAAVEPLVGPEQEKLQALYMELLETTLA